MKLIIRFSGKTPNNLQGVRVTSFISWESVRKVLQSQVFDLDCDEYVAGFEADENGLKAIIENKQS